MEFFIISRGNKMRVENEDSLPLSLPNIALDVRQLVCPLTNKIFFDPVLLTTDHTIYERDPLVAYVRKNKKSPTNSHTVDPNELSNLLIPAAWYQKILVQYLSDNPFLVDSEHFYKPMPHQKKLKFLDLITRGDRDGIKRCILFGQDVNEDLNRFHKRAIHYVAEHGHEAALRLLIEHGAELIPVGHSTTPLHLAIRKGHVGVVDVLLRSKVNVNEPDSEGRRAIHVAILAKQLEILRLLLSYRKTLEQEKINIDEIEPININEVDYLGNTAAHFAIEEEISLRRDGSDLYRVGESLLSDLLQLLLMPDVIDTDVKNKAGDTVREIANKHSIKLPTIISRPKFGSIRGPMLDPDGDVVKEIREKLASLHHMLKDAIEEDIKLDSWHGLIKNDVRKKLIHELFERYVSAYDVLDNNEDTVNLSSFDIKQVNQDIDLLEKLIQKANDHCENYVDPFISGLQRQIKLLTSGERRSILGSSEVEILSVKNADKKYLCEVFSTGTEGVERLKSLTADECQAEAKLLQETLEVHLNKRNKLNAERGVCNSLMKRALFIRRLLALKQLLTHAKSLGVTPDKLVDMSSEQEKMQQTLVDAFHAKVKEVQDLLQEAYPADARTDEQTAHYCSGLENYLSYWQVNTPESTSERIDELIYLQEKEKELKPIVKQTRLLTTPKSKINSLSPQHSSWTPSLWPSSTPSLDDNMLVFAKWIEVQEGYIGDIVRLEDTLNLKWSTGNGSPFNPTLLSTWRDKVKAYLSEKGIEIPNVKINKDGLVLQCHSEESLQAIFDAVKSVLEMTPSAHAATL